MDGVSVSQARKHVSIACEPCRSRKQRCDGVKPMCSTCNKAARGCTYRTQESARRFHHKQFKFKPSTIDPKQRHVNDPELQHESQKYTSSDKPKNVKRLVRVSFFRYFGPTAIASGLKTVYFNVEAPTTGSSTTIPGRSNAGDHDPAALDVFDDDKLKPRAELALPLVRLFFDHFQCHFPFYSRITFLAAVEAKEASALLVNSMCALAARFSDLTILQTRELSLRGQVFANKAKTMLVPLLNLPSHEVVASLLLIAWHELANNHDAGLYMYTGMACRMALDLGMEKAITTSSIEDQNQRTVLLSMFWTIDLLENIICFATGRPSAIRSNHIEAPHLDKVLHAYAPDGLPSSLACALKIVQYLSLISEAYHLDNVSSTEPSGHTLLLLGYSNDLIIYYTSLDPRLSFNIQNFRTYIAASKGSTYLLLHIWFNAIIIILHRPSVRFRHAQEQINSYLAYGSRELSISAARTISSIINLAELLNAQSLLACPFIDQALALAGIVFSAEISFANPEQVFVASLAQDLLETQSHHQNYLSCLQTLQRIMVYWKGIGWVVTTMQRLYNPATTQEVDDTVTVSVDPTLPDPTMLAKFLGKMQHSEITEPLVKAREDFAHGGQANTAIGLGVTGLMTQVTDRDETMASTVRESSFVLGTEETPFWLDPSFSLETFTMDLW